ncbi:MAG: hypothetical protein JW768_05880 [Chitinispirillaceae bacterium]|nr:hypothetical protein [Chitinispirillaceae bacterium]
MKKYILVIALLLPLHAQNNPDSLLLIFEQAEQAHKAQQDSIKMADMERKASMEQYTENDTNDATQEAFCIAESLSLAIGSDPQIDSLQRSIDNRSRELFKDKSFKKINEYSSDQQREYLLHLLKHKIKDTVQVLTFAAAFIEILRLEQQKMKLLMDLQQGNSRYVINLHIRAMQRRITALNNLTTRLTPQAFKVIHYGKNQLDL